MTDENDAVVERTELIAPEASEALVGLLDVAPPDAAAGLPLTWHWLHLLDRPRQRDLGPDGHPVRHGVPAPPGPGRRRMWAGGEVRSLGQLRVGEPATRTSRVLGTTEKTGRSGVLTFVAVGHTIRQRGEVVVEERHDVLYRSAEDGAVPGPREPVEEQDVPPSALEWAVPVSPSLLFRFSALTYNGHRIHYDRDYARSVEGYPGLVVHGPLQAMAMAEAARRLGLVPSPGVVFGYRLIAPLFDHQGLVAGVVEDDGEVRTHVRDVSGRRTAQGWLRPA